MPDGSLSPDKREQQAANGKKGLISTRILRFRPSNSKAGEAGFVVVELGIGGVKHEVKVTAGSVYPPLKEGGKFPSTKDPFLVLREDIDWTDPQKPVVARAFWGEGAYEAWQREEQERLGTEEVGLSARSRSEQLPGSPPVLVETESSKDTLDRKFGRIEQVYPARREFGVAETLLNAVTAEIPLDRCVLIKAEKYRYVPGDDYEPYGEQNWSVRRTQELSNRRHPQGYEPGYEVVLEGTEYQKTGRPKGPESVLVRLKVKAKPDMPRSQPAGEFKPIVDPEDPDYEWISQYKVSPEDANKIWDNIKWWMLTESQLKSAISNAQRVVEAQKIWQEEFPGIHPGDLQGAVRSVDPSFYGYGFWSWTENYMWQVPPFLLRLEGEILEERRQKLVEMAKAGEGKAIELLATDAREAIGEEIWTGFPKLIVKKSGSQVNWYSSRGDIEYKGYLETEPLEDKRNKELPSYRAYIEDKNGEKIEVATATVDETRRGNCPYYRVHFRGVKILEFPGGYYQPGSLKWEEISFEKKQA